MSKKTKIICTIGPASIAEDKLAKLLKAGMNVIRLNFAHGDFKEHLTKINNAKKAGIPFAVLQDLGGPKIRIGTFGSDKNQDVAITLKKGQKFTITTDEVVGDENKVSVNYPLFAKEVKAGDQVFLQDGKKKLKAIEVKGNEVICEVIVGGELKGRKGVNLPDSELTIPALTDKDIVDLEFGIKNKVEYICLSFVRRADDIIKLREILAKRKSTAKIIAKIETPQAMKRIDQILPLVDGIMVGRGDLSVEVPRERVNAYQKILIGKAKAQGKIVILATTVMESMIKNFVPTAAEVGDVTNAILEGADMVMTSDETATGDYPVETVETMARIAEFVENSPITKDYIGIGASLYVDSCVCDYASGVVCDSCNGVKTVDDSSSVMTSITKSAVVTADMVGAKLIANFTLTGLSANWLSSYKPVCPIISFTPNESTAKQLIAVWGVTPVLTKKFKNLDEALKEAKTYLIKNKLAVKGDKVVFTYGHPFAGKDTVSNAVFVETL